jgi:hypothetical protein
MIFIHLLSFLEPQIDIIKPSRAPHTLPKRGMGKPGRHISLFEFSFF